MIELHRHIEILLLDSDCVIVPGFGGFMAHHVDAVYDNEDGTFLPPYRTIGFNSQLRLNDSLLAQSYIEAYDISYPEAMRRIEAEVDELREVLQNEGAYEFENLGRISVNQEGKYEFQPLSAGILSPELYGMGGTQIFMRNDGRRGFTEVIETGEEIVSKQALLPFDDPDNVHTTDNNEDDAVKNTIEEADTSTGEAPSDGLLEFTDNDKVVSIKVSWIRNAVAVAAAIAAFFFIVTPVMNSRTDTVSMSHINSRLIYSLMPKDAECPEALEIAVCGTDSTASVDSIASSEAASSDDAQSAAADSNAESKEVAEKAEQAEGTTIQKATVYTIVLASQVRQSRAEEFVAQLQKAGHKSARVFIRNNVVRVVYGEYASEADASSDLQAFHRMEGFEEAWIYKIQN